MTSTVIREMVFHLIIRVNECGWCSYFLASLITLWLTLWMLTQHELSRIQPIYGRWMNYLSAQESTVHQTRVREEDVWMNCTIKNQLFFGDPLPYTKGISLCCWWASIQILTHLKQFIVFQPKWVKANAITLNEKRCIWSKHTHTHKKGSSEFITKKIKMWNTITFCNHLSIWLWTAFSHLLDGNGIMVYHIPYM